MKLLDSQSSPKGESSDSVAITESFIEACKSYNTSIVVDSLGAWHERRPDFDCEAVGAKYQTVKYEAITEAEYDVGERIQSLIQRFQSADLHDTSRIFLHHVLEALKCHFVSSYGVQAMSTSQYRGGLSPWQTRKARELLEAQLDGDIALREVAEACGLSVGHFARAFKTTFRRPPYRWLTERRVDRARHLMMNSNLPLADIATRCGFADQSALNRSFKKLHGISPGIWRRGATRGSKV